MERSIATLKVNTIKNETRTKLDIKKRTTENRNLIEELNQLRKENKENKVLLKTKQNECDKLRQDLKKLMSGVMAGASPGHAPSAMDNMGTSALGMEKQQFA